ncbi:c-type cytochrome [Leptobacterium flavescens]|uniref:C-type cytochrome n=1 Tax=Leptobacterium flavescens TaxID=472055 RepID=A0A6P0UPD1_9FLAO|nr:cbb3-type cytochrome c oxidase N-terminal domain-containing protein [Leptobacterium flavescens]NER14847.1 c-type cytochrome [Leptobacterium flavescens]
MRTTASYLRIIGYLIFSFLLMELTIDSGDQMAIEKYPVIWAILGIVLLFSMATEICVEALRSILVRTLKAEAKEKYMEAEAERKANQFGGLKRFYKKMLGSKPLSEEHEIILDHNYDGIKELDNDLPPWWLYGFYATIIFAVIYMARYHIFDGVNQAEEYEIEVAEARAAIEEYKRTAKDLVDVNTVTLLTDASDLQAGKTVFMDNCVACHKADGGGGIGPNLTDEYWILGGGIKNVFRTISEGGRDGKGMISWKQDLKPVEMAQVASYILTLQGTTPAEPKAPEGDIWTEPDTETKQ